MVLCEAPWRASAAELMSVATTALESRLFLRGGAERSRSDTEGMRSGREEGAAAEGKGSGAGECGEPEGKRSGCMDAGVVARDEVATEPFILGLPMVESETFRLRKRLRRGPGLVAGATAGERPRPVSATEGAATSAEATAGAGLEPDGPAADAVEDDSGSDATRGTAEEALETTGKETGGYFDDGSGPGGRGRK